MIALAFVLFAVQESRPGPGVTAAKVNGTVIRWADVYARVQHFRPDLVTRDVLLAELRSQVWRLLISQEAERLRIAVTPREVDEAVARTVQALSGREALDSYLRVRGWSEAEYRESRKRDLLESHVSGRLVVEARQKGLLLDDTVSAEEVQAFYAANRESFRARRRLAFVRIGLRWSFPWERDHKQEIVRSLRKALERGANFRTLARTFNEIPGEGVPRDLCPGNGILSRQMNRYLFESVATQAVSPIVWEGNSVNLFYVVERVFEPERTLEQAESTIRAFLMNRKWCENWKRLRRFIRQRARIEPPGLFELTSEELLRK